MLHLGLCKPRLQFQVGFPRLGEEFLPVTAAWIGAPKEELAPLKPVGRGLDQALALSVQSGLPFPPGSRNVEKEVHCPGNPSGVASIDAVIHRHFPLGHFPGVIKAECLRCRSQYTGILRLVHRNV